MQEKLTFQPRQRMEPGMLKKALGGSIKTP